MESTFNIKDRTSCVDSKFRVRVDHDGTIKIFSGDESLPRATVAVEDGQLMITSFEVDENGKTVSWVNTDHTESGRVDSLRFLAKGRNGGR